MNKQKPNNKNLGVIKTYVLWLIIIIVVGFVGWYLLKPNSLAVPIAISEYPEKSPYICIEKNIIPISRVLPL